MVCNDVEQRHWQRRQFTPAAPIISFVVFLLLDPALTARRSSSAARSGRIPPSAVNQVAGRPRHADATAVLYRGAGCE